MRQHQLAKQPSNYDNKNQEKFKFEQKPMKKFDEFSDGEKEELKIIAKKTKNRET